MRLLTTTVAAILAMTATVADANVGRMRVRIGDLDLSTEMGARKALARIDLAARDFCVVPLQFPLAPSYMRCRREMMARAVGQLDAPLVTAMAQPAKPIGLAKK